MVFVPGDDQEMSEAAKIAPIVVPYLQGRALDIGSGQGKVWPRCIGIDVMLHNGKPITDIASDGIELKMFASDSADAVFSSHFLQEIPRDKVPGALAEWTRVLKTGGYLVLYVPSANLSPLADGSDPHAAHKWNIYPGDIEKILKKQMTGRDGWRLIMAEERNGGLEYSLLIVLQKTDGGLWEEAIWERNPDGKKRALVIRYGAIGDAFVAASVLPGLKAQGYHITFNTQETVKNLLLHDPHIDEWLIQDTDFVPNQYLGPYWTALNERYDRVVNLCESVEGLMLSMPGRLNHAYSDEARKAIYGEMGYLEHTHNIAAVPYDFSNNRFYPTEDEVRWARAVRKRMEGHVVVWCVNGSSPHKVYPFTQVVCKWLMEHTDAQIVLYGDPKAGKTFADGIMAILEKSGAPMHRIISICDKWKIRQSLAFAQIADVIVGPETGPLNAVAMEDIPKVIYLSHSSATNLTKHWRNTTTLIPDVTRVPCYPCHRLHYDWSYCHQDQKTQAALCATDIKPEDIMNAIVAALGLKKAEAAA